MQSQFGDEGEEFTFVHGVWCSGLMGFAFDPAGGRVDGARPGAAAVMRVMGRARRRLAGWCLERPSPPPSGRGLAAGLTRKAGRRRRRTTANPHLPPPTGNITQSFLFTMFYGVYCKLTLNSHFPDLAYGLAFVPGGHM